MIHYKTPAEIESMRESALLVSKALTEVAKVLRPGMTTLELDKIVSDFIRDNGAVASFLNYRGYPFSSCISVNDVVVHGFPNDRPLKEGDIISVDIGVIKKGYHGDHAYTFAIGDPGPEVTQLIRVTKEALYKGIEKAVAGGRVGDISFAIEEHTAKRYGYGIVRELVGHGLGKHLHEEPQVPNYGRRGTGPKLREGLVLAIEPMINLGKREVYTESDGWTVRTADHQPSVHFEHDVAVKKGKADILSDFSIIEAAERANPHLHTGQAAALTS
jgi:methionyl aminopeptidase